MKTFATALFTMALTSASAFAHSGGQAVTCKSANKSGSKQVVAFELTRANSAGLSSPMFSVTLNGQKTDFTTEDADKTFGETFHNSPLGVITVTANNSEEENASIRGYFTLTAIPSTVQAYNAEGKLVKWSFKAEKNECNDANGKATFKGLFRGSLNKNTNDSNSQYQQVDLQIMDCEISYNSGMAC